jgi:predicted RNA-binding protein with PUA-like domain
VARWLFKTEPSAYSFERLLRDKRTVWDGISNPLAVKHLASVRKGDEILVYHTGSVRAVVGLARASSDGSRASVDIEPVRHLGHPVPLEAIKKNPAFKNFDLVRISRLSVMPVPDPVWDEILRMAT